MLLRDAMGQIIFSACRFLPLCSEALEAELLACLEGVGLALHHSELPFTVETDCLQLAAAVNAASQDRSAFIYIISEIKDLAKNSRVCSFVKVHLRQIKASLANFARTAQCTQF
jgi:hypothetical protein